MEPLTLSVTGHGDTPLEAISDGVTKIQDWLRLWDFPPGFTVSITRDNISCDAPCYQDPVIEAIFQEVTTQADPRPWYPPSLPAQISSENAKALWLC